MELEARVLAGQSVEAVGGFCGLDADVVEAYVQLYFDVRGKLQAGDYITAVVIGVTPDTCPPASNIDSLLMQYAYHGGPLVLEALLDVLNMGATVETGADREGNGTDQLAKAVRMAVLARSIPISERTAPGLVRLNLRLLEVEREAAGDTAIMGPIKAYVEPLFGSSTGLDERSSQQAWGAAVEACSIAGPAQSAIGDRIRPSIVGFPELDQCLSEISLRQTA